MDDQANVEQPPIRLQCVNIGQMIESVIGFSISFPPDGCGSQQLLDFAAVTGAVSAGHVPVPQKLRVIQAYATKWEIELIKQDLADWQRDTEKENAAQGG